MAYLHRVWGSEALGPGFGNSQGIKMNQGRFQLGSLLPDFSVNDIIALHPSLGIPHFQRGLVWDPSNVALLRTSWLKLADR